LDPSGPGGKTLQNTLSTIKFKTLDVRPCILKGEEPLPLIRKNIDALKPGQGLTVVAPFMPAPLVELLKSEGFLATLERREDGAFMVNFWRRSPPNSD
jgi:uncharacterized protein (DUF2249 family)